MGLECNEPGHYKNECPKLQKENPKKKFHKKKSLMATWDESEDESDSEDEQPNCALMATEDDGSESTSESDSEEISLAAKRTESKMSWYLDSGCSRHMTGRRSTFQNLVLNPGGEVKFGGDQKGKIIGSGTISLGNSPSITNVLLVEGLTR